MLLRYAVEGDTTAQRYKNTVISDSGTVQNAKLVQDIVKYYKNSGRWGNIRLMVAPSAGINIRDSSPYKYTSKLYSFDRIPNNVAQSTAGLQPYLSGFIAPNEKYAILNPNGGSKIMSHNAISFGTGDKWTVSILLNWNGSSITINEIFGDSSLVSFYTRRTSVNKFGATFTGGGAGTSGGNSTNLLIGKNQLIHFVYNASNVTIFVNGISYDTIAINGAASFSRLLWGGLGTAHAGKDYFYSIEATALSAAQCLADFNFWRSYIPEIETVQIGTQQWASSNLDIVTTPMGTAIPEVTDNAAWAALTTPAWCHYTPNGTDVERIANGAIYGKLYNWYAVKQIQDDITAYNLANPTKPWGYHVPTQAELTTLQTYLGGSSVAGGKMKVAGTTYFASPNTGATNESGFSALGGGRRSDVDGSFGGLLSWMLIWTNTESGSNATRGYISNTSTDFSISTDSKKMGMPIRLIKD